MASLSTKNGIIKYLLCVIDVFSKYAWVNLQPLKHKKAKTVIHAFYERVNESKRKPNTLWVDQKKEFYNRSMVR